MRSRLASSSSTTSTVPGEPASRIDEGRGSGSRTGLCILRRVSQSDKVSDFRNEGACVNWFSEITRTAGALGHGLIALHGMGGQRDNRQMRSRWILPQGGGSGQAVHAGKAQIHQNQIRSDLLGGA